MRYAFRGSTIERLERNTRGDLFLGGIRRDGRWVTSVSVMHDQALFYALDCYRKVIEGHRRRMNVAPAPLRDEPIMLVIDMDSHYKDLAEPGLEGGEFEILGPIKTKDMSIIKLFGEKPIDKLMQYINKYAEKTRIPENTPGAIVGNFKTGHNLRYSLESMMRWAETMKEERQIINASYDNPGFLNPHSPGLISASR
jgi:hypothetical protein